jgi:hypothetical protein
MLPPGLVLGPYPSDLNIDSDCHPVVLCFNDVFRAHLSVPSLIPNLTYHEFHIGVPYTYLSSGTLQEGTNGPYYFMPRLYLDRWLPIIGGVSFWGLAKEPARIHVTENSYRVTSLSGQPLASLSWNTTSEDAFTAAPYSLIIIIRAILSQTMVSRMPAAVGPFFSLSDFIRYLDIPIPIPTTVEVDALNIQVQPREGLRAEEWQPGVGSSVLGGFTAFVPWVLSLPYLPPRS